MKEFDAKKVELRSHADNHGIRKWFSSITREDEEKLKTVDELKRHSQKSSVPYSIVLEICTN